MTGFGRGVTTTEALQITIEMRSVNHRFLEIHSRFPKEWLAAEMAVKKSITQVLARGKVDVNIYIKELAQDAQKVAINMPLIEAYQQAKKTLQQSVPICEDWTMQEILMLEGALVQEKQAVITDDILVVVNEALQQALENLVEMRAAEGACLAQVLHEQGRNLQALTQQIRARATDAVAKYQQRLQERIQTVAESAAIDERIVTEVAIYAERVDIVEELDRLDSHFTQLAATLASDAVIGRKLDFLMQEMHREINTIGSKNQHAEISVLVVEAKTILEKMREQVQNIE